jgi:phosphohistidine phosphatase
MSEPPGSIFFVRHAKAEPKRSEDDWARGLTPKGRRQFRTHARKWAKTADLRGIATSPWVRAVQTAEILASATGLEEVRICAELAGEPGVPAKIVQLVRKLGSGWAVVGHNPSLTRAAALACGLKRLPVKLKKGSILELRVGRDGYALNSLTAIGRRSAGSLR